MKKTLIILSIAINFTLNAQSWSVNDSLFTKYANYHDKYFLDVSIQKSLDTYSIFWLGDCEEIQIESNNGQFFPKIDCLDNDKLHLHNLSPGIYTLKFYYDEKLLRTEVIKT